MVANDRNNDSDTNKVAHDSDADSEASVEP